MVAQPTCDRNDSDRLARSTGREAQRFIDLVVRYVASTELASECADRLIGVRRMALTHSPK